MPFNSLPTADSIVPYSPISMLEARDPIFEYRDRTTIGRQSRLTGDGENFLIARSNVTSDAREIDRDLIIKLESDDAGREEELARTTIRFLGEGMTVVGREGKKKGKESDLLGEERMEEGQKGEIGWEEDKTEGSEGTEFLIKFLFRSSYPPRSTEPDKAVRVKRSYRK